MLQDGKVLDTPCIGETSLLDYSGQHSCHISNILSINCMFIALLEFNVCACDKP